ncbi:universal stress protein [Streptomyces sp. NPDC090442]|uniref:universal stress protein n=1 Tax=Streptomyces sp. NPDC090442 TaxID=3365962 RepID=UPI00380D2929
MDGPVVVGLDGTGNSAPAVRWGVAEATARKLPLHLLHSWSAAHWPAALAREETDLRRHGTEVLVRAEAVVEELHPGMHVVPELVGEEAPDALAERSGTASLLVLGSRRHDAIAGFLLGSVSLRVLGRAECPVVTVREDERSPVPAREIVVGVQEPGTDEAVLDYAFTAAEAHRVGLCAVHAWTPGTALGGLVAPPADHREDVVRAADERELLRAELVPWREKFPEVHVAERAVEGRTAPVLLRACSRAGLLVVGRQPHRSPMPLGPAVLALLHHSCCPVAVVPRR